MKNRLLQAYRQAPWRVQRQWIGLFLLALVLVAAVAGIYLNISQQAAATGRRIQSLEYDISQINNDIAVLTTNLAKSQSAESLQARAKAAGFVLLDPQTAVYLQIPGFHPNPELALAPPRPDLVSAPPVIQSKYKISLWQWFAENIWQISADPVSNEVEP